MQLLDGLPHLDATRGAIVRALYCVVAGATLIVLIGSLVFTGIDDFRNVPNSLMFGFRTWTEGGRPVIRFVTADAARAGLRDSDRIVAIDGVELPANATEFDIGARLGHLSDDETIAITTRSTDGRVGTHTLRREDGWRATDTWSGLPAWLYASLDFVNSHLVPVFLIAASLLLFRRRARDPEAMFFAFAFLLIAVSPIAYWIRALLGVPIGLFNVLINMGWSAAVAAMAGFPDGRYTSRLAKIVAVAAPLLLLGNLALRLFELTPLFVPGTVAVALLLVAAAASVLLRYRATAAGPERQQIKWAVTGFCAALLAVTMLYALSQFGMWEAPGQPGRYLLGQFLNAMLVAMPLGLLVSLLRYRLYDADTAISRSIAYGALTLALLAIFAGSEKLIEALGEEYFGGSLGALAGGLGAAIAAVMIVPLHHRLTHWAERRFQGDLAKLRRGLPLLVGDMRETATLEEVADIVLRRVERGVRAARAALVIDGAETAMRHTDAAQIEAWRAGWQPREAEGLDCMPGDPIFPMRVPLDADGCGRVGWLLLGPRPDGSFFGKDEREALAEIADPLARAISIVRRREANAARLETRIEALETSLARLAERGGAPA